MDWDLLDNIRYWIAWYWTWLNSVQLNPPIALTAWLVLASAIAAALVYFVSSEYEEKLLGKRKQKERWRRVNELVNSVVTKALEDEVEKGNIQLSELSRIYRDLREVPRHRDIGTEPSFGRPWYYGPTSVGIAETKRKVLGRLKQAGVDVRGWLTLRRVKTRQQYIDELMQSVSKPTRT